MTGRLTGYLLQLTKKPLRFETGSGDLTFEGTFRVSDWFFRPNGRNTRGAFVSNYGASGAWFLPLLLS